MWRRYQCWYQQISFQRQLAFVVALGVLLAALISSISSFWLGKQRVHADLLAQGKQITHNLAQQSALALIYASPENVQDVVKTTLSFPNVLGLEIRDLSNHVILHSGEAKFEAPNVSTNLKFDGDEAGLAFENADAWYFAAPVYSRTDDANPFQEARPREHLGFVSVAVSKQALQQMSSDIFFSNLSGSFAIAMFLLFIVHQITKGITSPLQQLSEVMRQTQAGKVAVRAKPAGPADIANMAHAFNNMVQVQEEREAALRVAAIAFETEEGMIVTDENAIVIKVNRAFCRLTGYCSEEVVGRRPDLLRSAHHTLPFYQQMWSSLQTNHYWQGEIWNRQKNGEIHPYWVNITAVLSDAGQVTNYVGTYIDIAERKQAELEIYNLAFFDPLTKLPNRRLLLERLSAAVEQSCHLPTHGALVFIDLDNFKTLNDTQGHAVGDLLLIEVARRLLQLAPHSQSVARLGGDEFVLLLQNLSSDYEQAVEQVSILGEQIRDNLALPFWLNGVEFHSSSSIGATLFSSAQHQLSELLKQADTAMYDAKKNGRNNFKIFDPSMQRELEYRAQIESGLREALRNQEFELYYQVQMSDRGEILGVEALLRWSHPHYGRVSPQQFVPLAEASGLIVPIGCWVLEQACLQLKQWEEQVATRHLQMAVNVSVCQFREVGFVEQLQQLIRRTGVNPARLKLELTESVVLHNVADTIAKMLALKQLGISFSMDDFGTGYSSLAYLSQLPLNQLKIDQSFVRHIGYKATDSTIVQTIIVMAQTLGMEVIAEGVETDMQRDFLAENGCKLYQGYLFGKPLPIAEFEQMLLVA